MGEEEVIHRILDRLEKKQDESNAVLTQMFSRQAVIANQVANIEVETKKTNGRVTLVEKKVDALESERDERKGMFKVTNVLVLTPVLSGLAVFIGWLFVKFSGGN